MTTAQYLFRFYKHKFRLFIISVWCLLCCYLTVGVVFGFSALVEKKTTLVFDQYFYKSQSTLTGSNGLKFSAGKLDVTYAIPPSILDRFHKNFPGARTKAIYTSNKRGIAYLVIYDKLDPQELNKFAQSGSLKILNSFTQSDGLKAGYVYIFEDHVSKFSIFSFQNQLSASVLGDQLSTEIGKLAKLIFIAAGLLTFYVTLLHFRERKEESGILIIQGYVDLNFKITFIDCFLQNILAFLFTIILVPLILWTYTDTPGELQAGINGLLYILPYLPVIISLQALVLLNQSMTYAAKLR